MRDASLAEIIKDVKTMTKQELYQFERFTRRANRFTLEELVAREVKAKHETSFRQFSVN